MTSEERYVGKAVIVTGSGHGIGLAYARAFAAEGAAVTIDASVEAFGGVDVLVNNAGLHMGQYNLTSTLPLADWRRL